MWCNIALYRLPMLCLDPKKFQIQPLILLMVQKSQTTTWDVENHVKNGINYQAQLFSRISSINSRYIRCSQLSPGCWVFQWTCCSGFTIRGALSVDQLQLHKSRRSYIGVLENFLVPNKNEGTKTFEKSMIFVKLWNEQNLNNYLSKSFIVFWKVPKSCGLCFVMSKWAKDGPFSWFLIKMTSKWRIAWGWFAPAKTSGQEIRLLLLGGEGKIFISDYQWLFLVPLNDGRDYITPQKAIYKWYISGIWGIICHRSHLLGEPETTIETIPVGLLHNSPRNIPEVKIHQKF